MKTIIQTTRRLLLSDDGPTAVEYAVMLALIVVVCASRISCLGSQVRTTLYDAAATLGGP
jgi:pilus assembly protein Flp/PilA